MNMCVICVKGHNLCHGQYLVGDGKGFFYFYWLGVGSWFGLQLVRVSLRVRYVCVNGFVL